MGLFVREIVGDATYSSFVMNLSPSGILLDRPATAASAEGPVQIEIRLPDDRGQPDGDPVWGLAQVVYDEQRVDEPTDVVGFRRSALRFSAMADAHRDRLETWLANQRGGERWEDLGQGVRVLRPG